MKLSELLGQWLCSHAIKFASRQHPAIECGEVCRAVFLLFTAFCFNRLMSTLKLHSNGPLYSNTVISTLAVDGWAVTFGTARRGLGGAAARPGLSWLYQM